MTDHPFTPGDLVRFINRVVGPRYPARRVNTDWLDRANYHPQRHEPRQPTSLQSILAVMALIAGVSAALWLLF